MMNLIGAMEMSYTARCHREDEEMTYNVADAVERCAEWLGDTEEGREYFFEAVIGYDEYLRDLDKLLAMTQTVDGIRTTEDFVKMGQKMSVFVDEWINKVASDDYRKIMEIIG